MVLEVPFRGFQVAATDILDLLLEHAMVLLCGVEPILAAVWLQHRLGQIPVHLTDGNGLDKAAFFGFVGQFPPGPGIGGASR